MNRVLCELKWAQIPKLLIAASGGSQHVKTVSLSATSYIHRVIRNTKINRVSE